MASNIKKSLKVLIIDDNVAIVKYIKALLFEILFQGIEVESADSLESAFKIILYFKCDIILLDLNIKDSSGLDTFVRIKQKHPGLPVIVISGAYKDDIGVRAVAMGAVDFIIKDKLDSYSLNKAINYAVGRKKVEKELLESEARWRSLVQNTSNIIMNIDSSGKILFINRNSPWISVKDSVGQEIYKFVSSDNRVKIKKAIDTVFRDVKVTGFEFSITQDDNPTIWYSVRLGPIIQDDRVVAANMTVTDITEREKAEDERIRLEKQLRQSRTLESIGTLASGIAHEINTPMQYIQDNTLFFSEGVINLFELINRFQELMKGYQDEKINSLVEKALKDADIEYLRQEIPSAINQSLEGIDRVKRIVNAMKFFSHVDGDEMKKADINQAIDSSIMVSKNEWKYVADLKTDLDPSIPEIKCFIGGINQVLMNLIVNAAQAISEIPGDGGKDKGLITVSSKKENNSIVVAVRDNGAGIPENIRDRIFDPFFTTKDVGKGTGQGLSIAYDIIVNKHKGGIDVDSKLGEGSTFSIRLPIIAD